MYTNIDLRIRYDERPEDACRPYPFIIAAQCCRHKDAQREMICSVRGWKAISPTTRHNAVYDISKVGIVARAGAMKDRFQQMRAKLIGKGKCKNKSCTPYKAIAPVFAGHEYGEEKIKRRPCPLVAQEGYNGIEQRCMPLGIHVIPNGVVPIQYEVF